MEHYGLAAERIRVIPHGVPVPPRTGPRGSPTREPLILGFGGSSPVKNVQTLIHAFRGVERLIPHRLVIVGDRRRLGRVSATGASPRVGFLSWVSEEEKLALLDRAAVLVCPSLDEGFGFPALEAMARGCPVIASRAGSLPEVCADAAIYVDPHDAEGIVSALLGVLSQGRLRETLVEKGARRATTFDWDASAAEHLRLFREVIVASDLGRRASRWHAAALDAASSSPGVVLQGRDRP
jgi:glycosyltransferase involved in cell wall biosynthesis